MMYDAKKKDGGGVTSQHDRRCNSYAQHSMSLARNIAKKRTEVVSRVSVIYDELATHSVQPLDFLHGVLEILLGCRHGLDGLVRSVKLQVFRA
jgi:hypothetical protein